MLSFATSATAVSRDPGRRHFRTHKTMAAVTAAGILLAGLSFARPSDARCLSAHSKHLDQAMDFEGPTAAGLPGGWYVVPPGVARLEPGSHRDKWKVLRLESGGQKTNHKTVVEQCVKADFKGKSIQLQGNLRTRDVKGMAGLWLKEYTASGKLLVKKDMGARILHGTNAWKGYAVDLPWQPHAQVLVFGAILKGSGTVSVFHLRLNVDGKRISESPRITTINDTDREFDNGSGIKIGKLSKVQIANLVMLGKVWGFLKYYDPTVTAGHRQWDYALFRILPKILAAPDSKTANAAMLGWIKELGSLPKCGPCAKLNLEKLQLKPDLDWIDNAQKLGNALSHELQLIYTDRRKGEQFYVTLASNSGNPIFQHERSYKTIEFPDAGFQLLALYRFWNIVEYWYPYRNIIGENWDQVLSDYIPKLALATSRKAYIRQLMALISEVHDNHANLWSALQLRPPAGKCHLPVQLRFIQDQPVVTGFEDGTHSATYALHQGDVITRLNGAAVPQLLAKWTPYYGASNPAGLHRQLARYMIRGTCGKTKVGFNRNGQPMTASLKRVPITRADKAPPSSALSGPTFRLLSPQVAYLKLSTVKAANVAEYIRRAAGTKGLIIDIRNYPHQFVALKLGSLLVDRPTPFVRFTNADLTTPGAFHWTKPLDLKPGKPHYKGQVVILVNQNTQSQAEYTTMALRADPNATVVGSATAGADGNISGVPLPGGLFAAISGLGVFYPDKQPTQRIGIIPDFVVRPSIADIRAGDDPVLDKAIRLIVGPKVPLRKIKAMYTPSASGNRTY